MSDDHSIAQALQIGMKFCGYRERSVKEVKDKLSKKNFNYNIIKDTINKRNIVIEGFSFAPTESKRDYMFELNTIITTMKFAK